MKVLRWRPSFLDYVNGRAGKDRRHTWTACWLLFRMIRRNSMKLSFTRLLHRNLEQYPTTKRRLWYLTLAVLATIVLTYDVYVPTSVLPLVLHAFHLSLAAYNLYLVVYLLLSALTALAASVADRLGRANLTVFGLLACSLIILGIALSPTLVVFLVLGVLLGCVEGIIFVVTRLDWRNAPGGKCGESDAAAFRHMAVSISTCRHRWAIGFPALWCGSA